MKSSAITLSAVSVLAFGTIIYSILQSSKPSEELPTEAILREDISSLQIPKDRPSTFNVTVPFSGESLTLVLEKNQVFGKNTRFLVDDGTGKLKQIEQSEENSYLGRVTGHSEFSVSATLTQEGMTAIISRPGKISIQVKPIDDGDLHQISLDKTEIKGQLKEEIFGSEN